MSLKTKIFLVVMIILIGAVTCQYFYNRNLKELLENSSIEISVLEQNQQALQDSIAFMPDSVAILHTFIKDKEKVNKSLKSLYNDIKHKSDQNIKYLQNQIGLLEGEITFKDKVIDSLLVNTETEITDSTIKVPVLYDNPKTGLKIDAYTVGNFINNTAFVKWNQIKVTLPKLRIGLVYDDADSTIVAMIEANNEISQFKTVMSDELYKMIVKNTTTERSWMDYIGIITEIEIIKEPFLNLYVFGEFKDFYLMVGRKFDVYDKFSYINTYRLGYKKSIYDFTRIIK